MREGESEGQEADPAEVSGRTVLFAAVSFRLAWRSVNIWNYRLLEAAFRGSEHRLVADSAYLHKTTLPGRKSQVCGGSPGALRPAPRPAQSRSEGAHAAPAVYDGPESSGRSQRRLSRVVMGVSGGDVLPGQRPGGDENLGSDENLGGRSSRQEGRRGVSSS